MQSDWTQTTTTADDYIKNKPTLATVATSGSYNDLQDKPTIPAAYDDTTLSGRVTALENAGFLTTETDPNVPDWAKQQTKPAYTAQEVGALPASTTIPTKVSDLTNDSGFTSNAGTITGITMNGASKGTSGVVDLGTVITAHQDISGKANASDVYTKTQADTLLSGKQNTLTFDNAPTASSTNPVTSGGVKTYVDGKATITGITTSQDGTFTIAQSDGNSYTVNLNHVHSQYLKYELLADEAAYTALSTKDSSTLYLIPES